MNSTEAAQMARDHFYGVPGMHPDLGFDTSRINRVDDDLIVDCHVFSLLRSKMARYRVIISNDKVQSIEEVE